MDVYICSAIAQVKKLHRETLALFPDRLTVRAFLERQAHTLHTAHQAGDERVCIQISNWHPKLVCASKTDILGATFTLDDARITIAREHGFAQWEDVLQAPRQKFDPRFESAANAVVTGDMESLTRILDPELVRARSPFGHRATLLHYTAANGVETWRQTVPRNAPEIIRLLLKTGADAKAAARMYQGDQTTMALLLTSAHPAEAGVTEAMAAILREAGG